jgi:DnaJ-class molecular chaperone
MSWYTKVCKFSAGQMMTYLDALEVFGFEPNTRPTNKEIKARYRKLAILLHPDKTGGDDKKFKELNNANERLKFGPKQMTNETPRHRSKTTQETPKSQTDTKTNNNNPYNYHWNHSGFTYNNQKDRSEKSQKAAKDLIDLLEDIVETQGRGPKDILSYDIHDLLRWFKHLGKTVTKRYDKK